MGARFDDWDELMNFLPAGWLELAHQTKALKGLRQDKSPQALLRTMLLHCACGYSLRETAARARQAQLADMSDVALLKRFKKCRDWFQEMCVHLLKERGAQIQSYDGLRLRLFDATVVKEPGKTGSNWRVHYSVQLPGLECDHFELTSNKGKGAGESFHHFPIAPGDFILADRGYCRGPGLGYIAENQAYVTVRVHCQSTVCFHPDGRPFDFSDELGAIKNSGEIKSWSVLLRTGQDGQSIPGSIPGRICAMRRADGAALQARTRVRRRAGRKGQTLKPETLLLAQYMIVFSTFPEEYNPASILDMYRLRWQVELVFKRFKQIAAFGHLPKYDDQSSKAWLYGKLLVALLVEKLIAYAGAISPWRSESEEEALFREDIPEPVEGICFYVSSGSDDYSSAAELAANAFRLG